jgi:hypothetical protein
VVFGGSVFNFNLERKKRMIIDEITEKHFLKWLEFTVSEEEQEKVSNGIRNFLVGREEVILRGYSWPEIRRIAEREGYI